ncbi:MAG: group III truncated hemoglobin [Undibacterium sp.]|uniref:group III truncated hemoglobin n=1 Tax=Undibacterium sp. TaxID=1914977 RepID=UPI00271DE151|nr:group III truncated hemoglobin [Undibacterium sp.]MDO8654023.1 group III truncated hemoglobin [Undibacterium sp.]
MKTAEITEASIMRLVHTFYDKVRTDELLGPVFGRLLDGKWESHLPRMVDFWSSILLRTGSFQGNVYGKHMALEGITAQHFVHWLRLFKATVNAQYTDAAAAEILLVADRIAGSLQLGFFGERPVSLAQIAHMDGTTS